MDRIATVAVVLALTSAATPGCTGPGADAQTLPVGPWPTAMVLDRRTGHAFVLNSGNNTVSVLDTRRRTLLRTTAVGTFPGAFVQTGYTRAIAVGERNERVFVGSYGRPGGITTLDAVSGRALSSIALPVSPGRIMVDEVTNRVFVSSDGVATTMLVSVLDATSGRLLYTITLNQGVGLAAIDERRGHVLAVGAGGVSVLDAHSGTLVRTIPGGPGPIVVNGRSGRLFVASAPGGSAGPTGAINVVDLTDGATLRKIEGLYPQYMTIAEGLNRVYATVSATQGPGHVAVIDGTSGRLIRTITVGRYPGQVVASARTGPAFVVNGQDGTVSMLDAQSGHVLRTIRLRPAQTNGLFDVEGTLSHLIALDEKAGRILVGNPSPYRFPRWPCPGSCPGLPPILTGPGSVSVLDAATGTLLRTVVVGRAPLVMALDDIAGHVIILNADAVGPRPGNGSVSIVAITP
jgi:DNA-binding beta-propeller fold protein YncE